MDRFRILYIEKKGHERFNLKEVISDDVDHVVVFEKESSEELSPSIVQLMPDILLTTEEYLEQDASFLEVLLEEYNDFPFIVLANTFDEDTVSKWYEHGAFNVVLKKNKKRLVKLLNDFWKDNKKGSFAGRERRIYDVQNNRFQTLVENSQDLVWQMAFEPNPHITYMNPVCETVTGYTLDELYSNVNLMFDIYRPEQNHKVKALLGDFDGIDVNAWHEIVGTSKSGELFWGDVKAFPLFNASNKVVGVQGVFRVKTDYKLLQNTIKDKEYDLKHLINDLPDPVLIFDYDGNLVNFNDPICKLLDVSREVLNKSNISSFLRNPNTEEFIHILKRVKLGERHAFEREEITKDGTVIPVKVTVGPLKSSGKDLAICIVQDLTILKKQSLNLLSSEKKYRDIFHSLSCAQLIVSCEDFRIVEANKRAAEMYGFSLTSIGNDLYSYDIIPLPQTHGRQLIIDTCNSTDDAIIQRHCKIDGTIFNVQISINIIDIGGINYYVFDVQDVTEKFKADQRLKLLNQIVEHMPATVMMTDSTGRIEYVNSTFTQVTGYTADEVVGKNPKIMKSGFHTQSFYKNLWSTLLNKKEWESEIHNRKKDGTFYWERARVSPVLDEEGKIAHFVSVKEDVTEQKEMMQNLRIEKLRAQESDRLKSEFLNNISHEIRTPLNGIVGFIDLLFDSDVNLDEEQQTEFVELIKQSSQRLISTITNIVEAARLEAGGIAINNSKVNMASLLNKLHDEFKDQADATGLEFTIKNRMPSNFELSSDYSKLYVSLKHLIENAFKFTQEGSVEIGCARYGKHIQVFVKDTGSGIQEELKSHIFEKFRQADELMLRNYEGAGLGLSIVKQNVNLIGGEINYTSEIGKGSTFYLNLPINANHD